MNLLIKITPEVLERAKMCGTKQAEHIMLTRSCAIAVALQDVFPNSWAGPNMMCIGGISIVQTPLVARNFIHDFDTATLAQRVALPPFSFTVELPDEVVERIDISDIEKSLTLELVG